MRAYEYNMFEYAFDVYICVSTDMPSLVFW